MSHSLEHVASGLEKIVASSLRRVPAADAPLLAWPVVCGHAVAERTRAVQFLGGVLQVEVPDKGWRTELRALAPRYLAAIHRYVAAGVERIDFVLAQDDRPGR
jgi:predicted nucleic acid-binding Zn ribbon protein